MKQNAIIELKSPFQQFIVHTIEECATQQIEIAYKEFHKIAIDKELFFGTEAYSIALIKFTFVEKQLKLVADRIIKTLLKEIKVKDV